MEQLGFDFDRGWAAIEGVVGHSSEPAEPIRLADAHKAADRVDVRTRVNRDPPSTLADVLELVTEAPDLAPNRRRDLVSALFLSPIFYPLEAVPADFRPIFVLNPLTPPIEQVRDALVWGKSPPLGALVMQFALAATVAWLGFAWFQKTRRGFADVL